MMQAYFANLLREKSASTIVIVKDNAACCREKPEDPTDPDDLSSDDENWQRPSSYKNSEEVNPAPTIPSRKESNDSLSVLSTLSEEEPSSHHKHHHRSLLSKIRGLKPTFHKRQRRQTSDPSSYNSSSEELSGLETKDDISVGSSRTPKKKFLEKQRNSWDGTDLSPMVCLNEADDISPTLPLRKASNDNLIEQEPTGESTAGRTPYYQQRRRSSLDNAPGFPSLKPNGTAQRRGSLDNSVLMTRQQTKQHFHRRGSLDSSRVEAAKQVLKAPRRLSLENSIIMADEQTMQHFQRQGSLENGLGTAKIDAQFAFSLSNEEPRTPSRRASRRGSLDNALFSPRRRSSLENALASSNSQTQLRSLRRASLDNTGIQSFVHQNKPTPRRSSLSTLVRPSAMVSSPNLDHLHAQRRNPMENLGVHNNMDQTQPTSLQRRGSLSELLPANMMVASVSQEQLRATRRSSMGNTGFQNYLNQKPLTPHPRRSSLSTYLPSTERKLEHSQAQDPPGRDGNALAIEPLRAPSLVPPLPPASESSFKKRILSKMSSPKWQSKMPTFSSHVFKISSSDDDSDFSEPTPPRRQISDDQLSLLSDDHVSLLSDDTLKE